MEEITPEAQNSNRKDKILFGVIAVLTLALVFQTGYLVKIQNAKKSEPPVQAPKQVRLYTNRPSLPQQPHFGSAWDTENWDPFMEMERLQETMNRMFRDSFQRAHLADSESLDAGMPHNFFEPDLDIQDLQDHYLITLDIPGMEKDKLNIEVRDQMLTVSGERTSASERKDEQLGYYSMERRVGAFRRSIPLPADALSSDVRASYEKGELRIEIPKKTAASISESKSRKIPVN